MASKNPTTITAEPGKQDIFIVREFDAPRDLVYMALKDPKLITQWLGPRGYAMRVESYDARPGGSYRYIHTDDSGNEFGFHGVFHECTLERTTQTFEFEGFPGHISLETALLEALPGERTRLTVHAVYQSVEDRDGMVQSGMERGVVDGHERLDELLETLQRQPAAR